MQIDNYQGTDKSCKLFNMTSDFGACCKIIEYGALITELHIPDKDGVTADIMLGLKDLDAYVQDVSNHGSVVGRSANRIKGATYKIGDVEYKAPLNDGNNNLHGGSPSYQNVFWDGQVVSVEEANEFISSTNIEGIEEAASEGVLLHYLSPDGACGFPGNLDTYVLYVWLKDRTLLIAYKGTSDQDTIFAPTNHSYFNLGGHDSGYTGNNILTIDADKVTHKTDACPDGTYIDVEGTIFDFRNGAPLKQVLTLDHDQTKGSLGVDQNFCVDREEGKFTLVATLEDDKSSRKMEVLTDMPGLQIYAGNHLGGNLQKGDIPYKQYGAVCLEAQMYPNAVNIPEFSTPIIKKGQTTYHACGYRFN
ncbi:MAG: galactose mutarotase [Saccharofermentans sp.]|nr:galactose mutarotase [Saccharofermentans sp.]